jgi:hypothetical protein
MSQRLQYEMHPDADQLNAFAESALPAHEREETLAHLAVCAGCREVLRLSLPAMEEVAAPVRVRRPWFSGWNLVWPIAVLAGLIVGVQYVRTRTAAERVAVPVQRADVTAPVVLPAPPPKAARELENEDKAAASARGEAERPRSQQLGSAAGRFGLPREARRRDTENGQKAAITAKDAEELPVVRREVGGPLKLSAGMMAGKQRVAGPSQANPGSRPAPVMAAPGLVGGSSAGVGYASAQGMAGGAAGGTTVATANDARGLQAADAAQPAVSAAQAAPAPRGVNQTVTVDVQSAGREIATTDAAVTGTLQRVYVATVRPLPSGLPAISAVAEKRQVVAIDLHNNVYFSKNGGKRWKAVAGPWQGRAMKVEMAASGVEFELTTDAHAVWLSADGRSWRQK